jgi:hypothetical protein
MVPSRNLLVKQIDFITTRRDVKLFAIANGSLYFFANSAATGNGLWKSDGTPGGIAIDKSFSSFGDLIA